MEENMESEILSAQPRKNSPLQNLYPDGEDDWMKGVTLLRENPPLSIPLNLIS